MAVYTALSEQDIAGLLQQFDGQKLVAMQPTINGIENTNIFVTTESVDGQRHERVLTLFESAPKEAVPWFVALLSHLAREGIPVPAPLADSKGDVIHYLHGKPCMLVPRLRGTHIRTPSETQCRAMGAALADIHNSSPRFNQGRNTAFTREWRERNWQIVQPHLDSDDAALLRRMLDRWNLREQQPLPRGITHGDLFHDNALFSQEQNSDTETDSDVNRGDILTGIIDFYDAGEDVLIYDLAIMMNDWCALPDGRLDPALTTAMLNAYTQKRPLSEEEKEAFADYQAFAATRFWLSRLANIHDPARHGIKQKPPQEMLNKLLHLLGQIMMEGR